MQEFIKVIFHLAHGKSVDIVWDEDGIGDLEDEINAALLGKPKWAQFGDLWVFTGAVSAIEIVY